MMKKIYMPVLGVLFAGSLSAQTTERLTIIEGFSSNTCPPCETWNDMYIPVLSNNMPNDETTPGVAVLKFQMDWPSPGNDPSNNDEADTRRGFYGVTGIPDWKIDGEDNDGSQAAIDSYSAIPAEMEIEAAYTVTGNDIEVTVSLTPLADLGGGSKLYIAVANKEYTYTGGTTGETEFHHVFRKMLPDDGAVTLGFLDANVEQTFTESYTYTTGTPDQTNNLFWDDQIEIVVWVQKSNSKEVWNAAVAAEGTLGIADGDNDDFGLSLYPNPANAQTSVVFDGVAGENVSISVYNALGELVKTENHGMRTGRQRVMLNTETYEAGMYFVKVQVGESVSTSNLMITK
jgi:hypothetical protein